MADAHQPPPTMTAHAKAEPAAPRRLHKEEEGGGQERLMKVEEESESEGGGSTGLQREDVTARRQGSPPDSANPEDDDGHRGDNDSDDNENKYTIVALYKFQRIEPSCLESLKTELVALLQRHEAFGNLLLAAEGVNGTLCYPTIPATPPTSHAEDADDEDPVRRYVRNTFPSAMMRVSFASQNVFLRLRIRIKAEVVTMGVPTVNLVESGDGNGEGNMDDHDSNGAEDASPQSELGVQMKGTDRPGTYVSPTKWNELLKDPSTLVIDTRNEYEIKVGTFQNAVNPHTTSFVEFPKWLEQRLLLRTVEDKLLVESTQRREAPQEKQTPPEGDVNGSATPITKLAFFCTGGVRCEKATAYAQRLLMEQQRRQSSAAAVPEVCHLKGGILGYLESVPPEQSMFKGECYVFDNRVAVTHGLQPTTQYQACRACRHPLSPEDIAKDETMYLEGRQCRYCADDPDKQARRGRYEMRHQQVSAGTSRCRRPNKRDRCTWGRTAWTRSGPNKRPRTRQLRSVPAMRGNIEISDNTQVGRTNQS
jgi:UPF0176 protein